MGFQSCVCLHIKTTVILPCIMPLQVHQQPIPTSCYSSGTWLKLKLTYRAYTIIYKSSKNHQYLIINPIKYNSNVLMFLPEAFLPGYDISKVYLQYIFSKNWYFSFIIMPYLSNAFSCIWDICKTKSRNTTKFTIKKGGLGISLISDLKSNDDDKLLFIKAMIIYLC